MSRRENGRGTILVECIVWVGVFAALMLLFGPMMRRALAAAHASRQTCVAVQAAETTLERMRGDLRRASEVRLPAPAAANAQPAALRALIALPDGTGAAYVLQEGSLIRYALPKGPDSLTAKGLPPDGAQARAINRSFEAVDVSPVADAPGLYRIDLRMTIRRPVGSDMRALPRTASFSTAVRLRSEVKP